MPSPPHFVNSEKEIVNSETAVSAGALLEGLKSKKRGMAFCFFNTRIWWKYQMRAYIYAGVLFFLAIFANTMAGEDADCGHITITGGTVHGHGDESCCGNWTGAMGAFHKDHRDNDWQDCKSGKYGWQRIYTGKCMRLHTWTAYNGYWEHVSYTANWWDYVHGRSEVIFEECNHVDGAYDITNCPYCHSYTLTLE